MAIVLTSLEPAPKHVILVPVANFADFFAALHVQEPTTGVVECQLFGRPAVVARKGTFAAISPGADRDALEKSLASTTNLAADASLAKWIDANKVSVVVTRPGVKQLLPILINGIRTIQAQIRQSTVENGEAGAAA